MWEISHQALWSNQSLPFRLLLLSKHVNNFIFSQPYGFVLLFAGLNEASEAYKVWKTFKDNKEQIEIEKNKKKPAPFKLVKVCVYIVHVDLHNDCG